MHSINTIWKNVYGAPIKMPSKYYYHLVIVCKKNSWIEIHCITNKMVCWILLELNWFELICFQKVTFIFIHVGQHFKRFSLFPNFICQLSQFSRITTTQLRDLCIFYKFVFILSTFCEMFINKPYQWQSVLDFFLNSL